MATRCYFDPDNAPDVTPAVGAYWDQWDEAILGKLEFDTPGNNNSVTVEVTEVATEAQWRVLVGQFVSEPVDAVSATGLNYKFAFRCVESAAKADATIRVAYGRCNADGSSVVTIAPVNEGTEFDDGVLTNRFYGPTNVNDLLVSQGQRLIVEVGVEFNNTKDTSYSASINFTDNHVTDLPENDTETTAYNSWFESGDTFTEASGEPAAIKLGPMFAFA